MPVASYALTVVANCSRRSTSFAVLAAASWSSDARRTSRTPTRIWLSSPSSLAASTEPSRLLEYSSALSSDALLMLTMPRTPIPPATTAATPTLARILVVTERLPHQLRPGRVRAGAAIRTPPSSRVLMTELRDGMGWMEGVRQHHCCREHEPDSE